MSAPYGGAEHPNAPAPGATLQSIVEAAVRLVPGVRWAGISLIEGRQVTPSVPTDELVAELDSLQNDLGEGPCLDALHEQHTVSIADTSTDTRWPQWGRAASDRGVRSVLAFQLFVREENLGALNLYGDAANVFTDESEVIGAVLAQHGAVAMIGAQETAQFNSALASRDVIGQAKGPRRGTEQTSTQCPATEGQIHGLVRQDLISFL